MGHPADITVVCVTVCPEIVIHTTLAASTYWDFTLARMGAGARDALRLGV